jgi:TolB-like protein/DNA-binding winged helix-turn-helix (wHTH) protein/Tfp pilus assembly protein PilF
MSYDIQDLMAARAKHGYRFGPYHIDATDRLLYKGSDLIALPPKVFDTLLLLVNNHGHVLPKEEMMKQLWPDTFVEEGTLTQYISLLRKALGQEGTWIENLPRRGYRFTAAVEEFRDEPRERKDRPDQPARKTRRRALQIAGVCGVLIVVASAWAAWYLLRPTQIRSIAVLPFVNLSGNQQLDYISDGLTDELTHALTRLPGIRVAARTSAYQFRGKDLDIRTIGQGLSVAGVLEGSVRFERNRIRVTAQLVDVRTGYRVWSETYEGAGDDLLGIQQRIGAATAQRLAREVHGAPTSASSARREVFLPYLEGRYFLAKGRPETFRKAAECFRQVISKDPNYAQAHSGLADTYYRWALWESLPPSEAFAVARQAAEQALALDESLAEAHASLANVKFQYDWDFVTAERAFRRSIELDPNRADTWHWFSHMLTAQGRFAESLEASKRAIELAPLDLPAQNHLGWCHYFSGDYDRAIQQHRRVLELDPVHGQTRLLLGRALLQRRLFTEALEQLRRNLELSPDSPERLSALAQAYAVSGARLEATQILNRLLALRAQRYVSAYSIATVYAALGAKSEALAYLRRAAQERSSRVVELKYEPIFQGLHQEEAFRVLVTQIGL